MIQKCEVFLFTIRNGQFSVLLLHRNAKRGDYWQPVTGSREPEDRSIQETAFREVFEETGIGNDDIVSVIPDVFTFSFEENLGKERFCFEEHCFGFEVTDTTDIRIDTNPSDEHDRAQWFTYNEALDHLKWDSNRRALHHLYSLILS